MKSSKSTKNNKLRKILVICLFIASCGDQNPSKQSVNNQMNFDQNTEGQKQSDLPAELKSGTGLIFAQGDGVRGKYGSIHGLSNSPVFLVEAIKSCTSASIRLADVLSHHTHVAVQSSRNDLELVQCVQRSIHKPFSAGLGDLSDVETGRLELDTTPFRELESVEQ